MTITASTSYRLSPKNWLAVVRGADRLGVVLTPDGIELRSAMRSETVAWTSILGIHLVWRSWNNGTGFAVELTLVPGVEGPRRDPPVLGPGADQTMRAYLGRRNIDIPVDPPPPWRDRLGGWHSPLLELDPFESVRTLRRAGVGPWLITVRPLAEGYDAVTTQAHTGEVVRRAEVRSSLLDATEDGVEQVTLAQEALSHLELES